MSSASGRPGMKDSVRNRGLHKLLLAITTFEEFEMVLFEITFASNCFKAKYDGFGNVTM